MIINSNGINASHTDEEINEIVKEKMLVEKYWWKRRHFERKEVVTEGSIGISEYVYTTVGTGYEIDEVTGKITLTGTSSVQIPTGKYILRSDYKVSKCIEKTGKDGIYYLYKTEDTEVITTYSNFEYIQSYNKNEYPTDDGAELDNYEYHYLGCPLTKAVLIDNTSEADSIALMIQNTYDITLLQLGITEE